MKDKKYGIGFTAAFTLALAVLKLLGIICCGWLMVLAPLIGTGFAGFIIGIASALSFLGSEVKG